MIQFFQFSHDAVDISCQVEELKSHFEEEQNIIDLGKIQDSNKFTRGNIICKFVNELAPIQTTFKGPVLQLILQEIKVLTGNEKIKPVVFKAVFHHKLAQLMCKEIKSKRITKDDLILIYNPTIVVASGKNALWTVTIELGAIQDQKMTVWKAKNNVVANCTLKCQSKNYNRLLIYYSDNSENESQAIKNLLFLVKERGTIAPLKTICKGTSQVNLVALAKFKKLKSSLTVVNNESEIHMSFVEILVETDGSAKCLFYSFSVFFFGELAEELQRAYDNDHIAPGDLVAICNPVFDKFTAAPVQINFSLSEQNNLIFVRCRNPNHISSESRFGKEQKKTVAHCSKDSDEVMVQSKTSKYTAAARSVDASFEVLHQSMKHPSDDNNIVNDFLQLNGSQKVIRLRKSYIKDVFDVFHFLHKTSNVTMLKHISQHLKQYGTIESLTRLCQKTNFKKIVLSFFIKLDIAPKTDNENKKTVLLLKEYDYKSKGGYFFKVFLHTKFSEQFCLAVEDGNVVQGDIVALVSPVVWQNTTEKYFPKQLFVVEIGGIKKEEMVLVYKTKINNSHSSVAVKGTITQDCSKFSINNVNAPSTKTKNKIKSIETMPIKFSSCNKMTKSKLTTSSENVEVNATNTEVSNKNSTKEIMSSSTHAENQEEYQVQQKEFSKGSEGRHLLTSSVTVHSEQSAQMKILARIWPIRESSEELISKSGKVNNTPIDNSGDLVNTVGNYEDFLIAVLSIVRPCLAQSELNLVCGYCSLCCKMFPHSSIVWSVLKDPLCPTCLLKLEVMFCIEVDAFVLSENSKMLRALLVEKDAEHFLEVSCKDFLENEEVRKVTVKKLEEKLVHSSNFKGICLRLSQVSNYVFK